jgi:hypothetical protein
VTAEVGMDLKNMKARKVGVFTDPNILGLAPMKAVRLFFSHTNPVIA